MNPLSPEFKTQARNRMLMDMGSRMLLGAGQGQRTGALLGSAALGGMNTYDQMLQQGLQSKLINNQLQQQQKAAESQAKLAQMIGKAPSKAPLAYKEGTMLPGSGFLGGEVPKQALYGQMMQTPGLEALGAKGLMGGDAESPWKNVKQDDLGNWYGINKNTKQVEQIPMGDQGYTKYKTVQGTGPGGNPIMELVNPGALSGQGGRITVGQKALPAETAAKKSMVDTAIGQLQVAQPILFQGDSIDTAKINEEAIRGMWAIDKFGPAAAMVSPAAGELYQAFEIGTQAITRTETGAAMPPEEVQNTKKRFMPKPWDSDAVVRQKWRAYTLFLSNIDKYLDPDAARSGKWDSVLRFNEVMKDAKIQDSIPPPQGFQVIP